ncbi:MAG TPA: SusD/RagB family nutrient-binding outer membrane lipoprotein [Bacteroidia bacterium]|jgi:hypothetical protein|nr:SusD/RagB family nutrient-binding outer membrane lipoprotein [Bacteroidia bacterium]
MKKIIIIFAVGLTLASCKKLSDLNVDTKNAENGDAPSETLFANGQRNLMDQVATPSVNLNIFRTVGQYWTETTYTDESNFNITTRKIPDFEFQSIYRDALADLKEAKKVIEKETDVVASPAQRANKTAITEMLMIYAFVREVDIFGNVPYSEALDITNVLPKYDDAQGIYAALFKRLDDAINSIDENVGGFPVKYDVIYKGNMKNWKAFGNSLKLKMAITVADVPALNPGTKAAEAVSGGVFTSAAQSALFPYLGASPNTNPIWVQLVSSGRKDWVAANTIVDKMNALADPRRSKYFEGNMEDSNGNVIYVGGTFGSSNKYANYTHITSTIQQPTWKGNLLDYSEVQFYLAEAAARNFISGSAQTYYNTAITSSILFWGGTAVEAAAYLLKPEVDYNNPLSGADYKEKIGTQAWIAYFDRPDAAWNSYRRLDFPKMNIPTKSKEPVPNRYTYPINEQTLNGTNYAAAAAAIGGDLKSTKLFWDKF